MSGNTVFTCDASILPSTSLYVDGGGTVIGYGAASGGVYPTKAVEKMTTNFIEYRLKVYDLTADSYLKSGNRLILDYIGNVEMRSDKNLRDYVLTANADAIKKALTDAKVFTPNLTYEVSTIASHVVAEK